MIQAEASVPLQHHSMKQFVKFCIIGLSSACIDIALFNLFTKKIGLDWRIAKTISFCFSVTNGFIWNSLWTFRGMGSDKRHKQYGKFVAVNIVGFVLNLLIINATLLVLERGFADPRHQLHLNIGNLVAIVIVSVWNFIMNKRWTFK